MKLFSQTIILICTAFAVSASFAAENLYDVIEEVQGIIIQKYPDESSIARKMALEDLEKNALSDKTDAEKIAAIQEKYPAPATRALRTAERGDAEAQYKLGLSYFNGDGVDQDIVEAVKWFRKAAEQGHVDAQVALGNAFFYYGNSINDLAESVKWLQAASEQGHVGAKETLNKAELLLNAQNGDSEAQFRLGLALANGDDAKQDYSEAAEWFQKAMKQGESLTKENLQFAELFMNAQNGDANAQFKLGLSFSKGEVVKQDDAEAFNWFSKAAEQGHAEAQFELAEFYSSGKKIKKDISEDELKLLQIFTFPDNATKWYQKSAENGSAKAQYKLGFFYSIGKGVKQDYTEAAKWYQKAADQGYVDAQFELGVLYCHGKGVKQNYAEAAKWFQKAADQGHDRSANILTDFSPVDLSGAPTVAIVNLFGGVEIKMQKVEAGTFEMSAKDGENEDNEVPHQATLKKDFYIGQTEVTQAQWKAVMNTNPSLTIGNERPVEEVSWNYAMEFCEKLNTMGKAPRGWKFTLPTETQWEYAARGGNKSRGYKYSGSNNAAEVAWCSSRTDDPHPVAQKKANELGLYDMTGNVSEWCLDDWMEDSSKLIAEFTRENEYNKSGPRASRGGCNLFLTKYCRSSARSYSPNDSRSGTMGFRLVLVQIQ